MNERYSSSGLTEITVSTTPRWSMSSESFALSASERAIRTPDRPGKLRAEAHHAPQDTEGLAQPQLQRPKDHPQVSRQQLLRTPPVSRHAESHAHRPRVEGPKLVADLEGDEAQSAHRVEPRIDRCVSDRPGPEISSQLRRSSPAWPDLSGFEPLLDLPHRRHRLQTLRRASSARNTSRHSHLSGRPPSLLG